MKFYTGIHKPSHATLVGRVMISIAVLRYRKGDFAAGPWLLDSGAFSEIVTHGQYRHPVAHYAAEIRRWSVCGELEAAVAQDFPCEPFTCKRTGLTVADHQRLTIERFDELAAHELPVAILPVLQGHEPAEYVRHVHAYGDRLGAGAWVGVGSVCKRNGSPLDVANVLAAIKQQRPDLRLHGFGVKTTALASPCVRALLFSADSMAWSYAARRQGRNGNSKHEAAAFARRIEAVAAMPASTWQGVLAL
jgi:hypothetical protein